MRKVKYEPQRDMSWKQSNDTYEPLDLTTGDLFKVKGEYGATFKFVEHVVNLNTGDEWITCYGGRKEEPAWRAFPIEKVKRIPKKRSKV